MLYNVSNPLKFHICHVGISPKKVSDMHCCCEKQSLKVLGPKLIVTGTQRTLLCVSGVLRHPIPTTHKRCFVNDMLRNTIKYYGHEELSSQWENSSSYTLSSTHAQTPHNFMPKAHLAQPFHNKGTHFLAPFWL